MQLKKRHRKHTYRTALKKCRYCGIPLTWRNATIDHIVPKSKNGSDDSHNLAIACNRCNNDKDDLSEADFRMKLSRRRGGVQVVFHYEQTAPHTNT